MNPSADTMRNELERAMRSAVATFPTEPRNRTLYLVAYFVSLLDLDVTLANRFLGHESRL